MGGKLASNLHEGARSEILADYVLSGWGSVSPARVHDDHGVDLFCTLMERKKKGKRRHGYLCRTGQEHPQPMEVQGQG
jgi:hypothetical protein